MRFFLKFEERTLLQSQQLLLFPKKLVSVFSFSARCHHSCKDVLTFVSFFFKTRSRFPFMTKGEYFHYGSAAQLHVAMYPLWSEKQ